MLLFFPSFQIRGIQLYCRVGIACFRLSTRVLTSFDVFWASDSSDSSRRIDLNQLMTQAAPRRLESIQLITQAAFQELTQNQIMTQVDSQVLIQIDS